MQRLWQRIDRWLFEEYRTDAVSLGFFRIFFGCYLVLRTLPLGYWIRELPPTSFCPPVSLAALFQHYPPHWIIVALNAATALCACTLVLGFHTVLSSIGVAVGLCDGGCVRLFLGSPPNEALSLHLGPVLLTLGLLMAVGFVFKQIQMSVIKLVIK